MTKSVWLMRFGGEYQIEVAKNIISDPSMQVVLCTVSENDKEKLEAEIGDAGSVFSNNEICLTASPPFKDWRRLDEDTLTGLSEDPYAFIAIQNLERNERFSGELSFADRTLLVRRQYEFWQSVFHNNKPDVIIFADVPHMYYELVVLSIARRLAIPCVIITDLFREGHILLDSSFSPLISAAGKPLPEVIPDKLASVSRRQLSKIDNVRKTEIGFPGLALHALASVKLILRGSTPYTSGYFFSKNSVGGLCWPSSRSQGFQQIRYVFESLTARVGYQKRSNSIDFSRLIDYSYFPLPSGFENIINPLAAPFDVKDLVLMALKSLPEGCSLVIKEHPMQFKVRHSIRQRRASEFFDWLAADERIIFAPLGADHFELIKNSKNVFALPSSSSFIEALAMDVEVTVFGKNKYKRSTKQVQSYKSIDSLDPVARPGSIFSGSSEDAQAISSLLVHFINNELL